MSNRAGRRGDAVPDGLKRVPAGISEELVHWARYRQFVQGNPILSEVGLPVPNLACGPVVAEPKVGLS